MREAVLLGAAFVCCVFGFAWLALAMDVHWQQVRDAAAPTAGAKRTLRVLAVVAFAISLALCLAVDHGSMASLVWIMSLAAGALIVTFALSWRPRWLAPFAFWDRHARDRA